MRRLVLLVIAVGAFLAPTTAVAAPLVYFSVDASVYVAPADGSASATLITTLPAPASIRAVVLDPASDRLFVNDVYGFRLFSAQLTPGSTPTAISEPSSLLINPSGLSIDTTTGTLFWSTEGTGLTGVLAQSPIVGGGAEIATPGFGSKRPWGLAYAAESGRLWWTQYATPSSAIRWVQADGSAAGTLDTSGASVNNPIAIALSRTRHRVYWSNSYNISSAAVAGGAGQDLIAADFPRGMAIDDAAGLMYWVESDAGAVGLHSADLDGGTDRVVTPPGLSSSGSYGGLALLLPPVAVSSPAIVGSPSVGGTLSCLAEAWASDVPESFAFRAVASSSVGWLRDGVIIPGATLPTYTPLVGGSYACQVTARNAAGSTASTSDAVAVPVTPTSSSTRVASLKAQWFIRGGSVRSTFTAPSGANRFGITARGGSASRRSVGGRCRDHATGRFRVATCTVALGAGRWSVTITASKGTTVVARSVRTVIVRRG